MPATEPYHHVHTNSLPDEQEASRPLASQFLGKRSLSNTLPQSVGSWHPNAGVPCYSFGPEESKRRCMQLHRTSMLFKDLEDEVHSVMKAKRAEYLSERAKSADIAAANPLVFPSDVTAATSGLRSSKTVGEEEIVGVKAGARKMPEPLSEVLLLQAMPELSTGAAFALKSCVDCWRDNRLADEDLV